MPTNFLIDGMMSGTGVRDAINGGYVDPETLGFSRALIHELDKWLQRSKAAHFAGHPMNEVATLDREGAALAHKARAELSEYNFGYFSDGLMKRLF